MTGEKEPYRVEISEAVRQEMFRLADDDPERLAGLREAIETIRNNPNVGSEIRESISDDELEELTPFIGRAAIKVSYLGWIGTKADPEPLVSLVVYIGEETSIELFNPSILGIPNENLPKPPEGGGYDVSFLHGFEIRGLHGTDEGLKMSMMKGLEEVVILAESWATFLEENST